MAFHGGLPWLQTDPPSGDPEPPDSGRSCLSCADTQGIDVVNQNVTLLSCVLGTLTGEFPTFKRFLFDLTAYVLLLHRRIKLGKNMLNTTTLCGNSYKTGVTAGWKAVTSGA